MSQWEPPNDGDKLLKRRLISVERQGMTDTNPSTVESGSTSSGGGSTHAGTNTDNLSGPGSTASPNSQRWRFDFDFNFDPSWLVTAGTNPPLSMINDWVRNRIPVSVGGTPVTTSSTTTTTTERGRGVDSVSNSNTSVPMTGVHGPHESHHHHHHHPHPTAQGPINNNTSMSQGSLSSRPRNSPIHQRGQTELGHEGTGGSVGPSGHTPPVRDSQSYVVQIQPDNANGEWAQEEETDTGEEQETDTTAESGDRSPSDIIRQNPEARAVFSIVERYAPFVLLLLIKGLFDHGSGIICFLALLVTFSHANSLFKKEVSKQSKRNIMCLIMITVNLLVCIAFIFYVFEEQKLYATLLFMPTNLSLTSIWTLFWLVGVTDYVAKYMTVIIKAIVLSLPQRVTPFQKRGKYYLFVEQSSQFYRSLLPLYPWICFFIEAYDGPLKVFGFLLAGLYCIFKAGDIVKRIKAWRISIVKLLQQVHYGTSPSVEEMTNAGSQCPICHDAFVYPTRLSCTHIFCEECVSTWFDRERTCPMCRAKVVDDPTYRDGSTTHFIQLF